MKKRILFIALAVVLALSISLIGCGEGVGQQEEEEEPEIPEYNLAISSTEGSEVTTPGEGTFSYDSGTVVNLVAEDNEGYRFVNWTGNVGTIANVNAALTTITMNGDYSITANFVAVYDLNISSNFGGSVTVPGEGMLAYDAGTVVSLVASPASGYYYIYWTGDVGTIADVNATTTTITMNGDYSIIAIFGRRGGCCSYG